MGNEAQMSSKNILERPCFIVVNIQNLELDTALLKPNSTTFYLHFSKNLPLHSCCSK